MLLAPGATSLKRCQAIWPFEEESSPLGTDGAAD